MNKIAQLTGTNSPKHQEPALLVEEWVQRK